MSYVCFNISSECNMHAQKGADIILSIITMILPWLIKRDD